MLLKIARHKLGIERNKIKIACCNSEKLSLNYEKLAKNGEI